MVLGNDYMTGQTIILNGGMAFIDFGCCRALDSRERSGQKAIFSSTLGMHD
jgi:hypothetical protein